MSQAGTDVFVASSLGDERVGYADRGGHCGAGNPCLSLRPNTMKLFGDPKKMTEATVQALGRQSGWRPTGNVQCRAPFSGPCLT